MSQAAHQKPHAAPASGADGHAAHAPEVHGRRKRKPEHAKHAHNEGWMMSFADLLTLMLCFFIMLIAFSANDETRTRKALGSLLGSFGILNDGRGFDRDGKYTASVDVISVASEQLLFATFEGYLEKEGIFADDADLVVDEAGRKRIRFTESFLFDSLSARFHPKVMPTLDRLAAMLRALGRPITIEGHTDQARGRESNWRLSAARAQAVLRYLETAGELPASQLTALGFAEGRPVEAGTAAGEGQKNRRVEIVVN